MGRSVETYSPEDDNSSIGKIISSLNYGLDFAFNSVDFDPLSLNVEATYKRGNYDMAAKNDAYGLSIRGLFKVAVPKLKFWNSL
jgi:hypothetical protein